MSDDDSKEEGFEGWIICGTDGETFVGKKVDGDEAAGKIKLFPCYKYTSHVVQIPQIGRDRAGHVVQTGINIAQQEVVASPAGASFDIEVTVAPSWVATGGSENRKNFMMHVKRLVLMARQLQLQARAAAAGVQTSSRLAT